MANVPSLHPRYTLPENPQLLSVEAHFASGQETWTRRALERWDDRFTEYRADRSELTRVCQRLERAFQKVCAGLLAADAIQGGLTNAEFQDWMQYGEVYAQAREPAFRVLMVRGIEDHEAKARDFLAISLTESPAFPPANLGHYGTTRATTRG